MSNDQESRDEQMEGLTTFQRAAAQNLEEVEERLEAIRDQINPQDVWDPSVDSTKGEQRLAEEYDRLLMSKSDLEEIVENGLP